MDSSHLAPLVLPDRADAWETWFTDRTRASLAALTDAVTSLKQAPAGDPSALRRWNDAQVALGDAGARSSLMSSVHPDPAVVRAAEEVDLEVHQLDTDLHLDAEVHQRLSALDADALDPAARRVLDKALLSFRRAGVDRDEETRDRVRELDRRASALGQTFSRGIREGRRTTTVPASSLAGLPEDYRDEHPVGEDGRVELSTDYPDTYPFLTYSEDPEARRAVAHSFLNLGWPDNDAVLAELLEVREERAHLLGYADWPTYDAELKMIGKGSRIPEFIDRISEAAEETGRAEMAELLTFAAREGEDVVDFSSWRHHLETLKRERFGVDAQEERRYFDFARVRAGLLDVTGRLFGLEYTPVDVPAWHQDVTTYDVRLAGETELLGRIHLDLHPRPAKYNHAAQFTLVQGVRDRQLPQGVLVCNFPRGLMAHDDVVTLFHEFGHLMHHVLAGRHEWVAFSGVSTEWDFVEAPSQMLEEWAWDPAVLRTFAVDAGGTPVPEDLVARMRAADEFGKGFLARTQMAYAALSYWLHAERPDDLTTRMRELIERYSLITLVPDTHFHTGFGHLEGYTSAYYTYMWSLVIAKDLFSAFDPEDLFAPEVATRYRDLVLAAGGSRDAADLVEEFLGRPYDDRAFAAWLAAGPGERGEEKR
ncbi:MAG: Peptidase [Marmoricola sp.]|nr:Peptidase [Marmoricola sp.]